MPGKVGQLVTLQEPQVQGLEESGLACGTQDHKGEFCRQSRGIKAAPPLGGGAQGV